MRTKAEDIQLKIRGTLITAASGVIPAVILIFILSSDPLTSISCFFTGPLTGSYFFGNFLNNAMPLILTGLGALTAFKAGCFNLGGEGQIYTGAVLTAILLTFTGEESSPWLILPIGLLASLVPALLAGFSGFLKSRWGVSELISTFLLSGIAMHTGNYLIKGPFLKEASNFITTETIPQQFMLTRILEPSFLSTGIFAAVAAVAAIHIFLYKTLWGFELRISGQSSGFAQYTNIPQSRYQNISLLLSGFLHGLGGVLFVLGTHHAAQTGFTGGLGWNGISAALLASGAPLGVLPAALFFSWLDSGASYAMIHSDMTIEFSVIIKAIIFFTASSRMIFHGWKKRKKQL